ncbi:hypothetical protein ACJ73_09592 [Blastomyces percursus]|uniref:C2H2-type domain-containing protein n=1 Tax=Blastomyces percursus TaxID=1658174 RepID=A0A1J9PTJ7_9EURO|nr:hypothetical protein ACJ73_09592 [Blastomyces percursus]
MVDGLANVKPHRKHMKRRQRSFHCAEPGCPREEGYGTINDLERHQKSRHGIKPTHGSIREYKCFGTNCATKDKIWPRKDNFKQHLRRVHRDENTEELLRRSNIWYDSLEQLELKGPGGHSLSAGSVQQELVDPKSYRPDPLQETTQLNNQQSHRCEATSMDNGTSCDSPHYPQGVQLDERDHFSSNTLNCAINSMSVEAGTEYLSGSSREDQGHHVNAVNTWDDIEIEQNPAQHPEKNDGDRPSSQLLPEKKQGPYVASFTEAVLGLFETMGKDISNLRSGQLRDGNGAGLFDPSDTGATGYPSQLPSGAGMETYLEVIKNGSKQSRDKALRELFKAGLNYLETSQADAVVASPGNTDLTSKDDTQRRRGKKVFTCSYDGCTRETGRMSEMKKHEKRHSRPYGCTQAGCHRIFGSKNDWKRHENTQHFQLQRWHCPVKASPKNHVAIHDETLMEGPDHKDFPPAFLARSRIDCGRVFDRKDKFHQHLQSEHSLDEKTSKQTVKRNEIGRNGQLQFWCGFCRKLIRLRKEGQDAWDERFDHIDNEHYKQKQNIDAWVHLEGNFTKKCGEKEDMTGDMVEMSDGLEIVEDVGEKPQRTDGGEKESTSEMHSTVPTASTTESIQQPLAIAVRGYTSRSQAPGALDRVEPGAPLQVSLAPATKHKRSSTMADSLPGDNVTHRFSSSNSASTVCSRQQQIRSQQAAAFGESENGYSMAVNPFVPDYGYVDVNGLILINNTVPQCAIISCKDEKGECEDE